MEDPSMKGSNRRDLRRRQLCADNEVFRMLLKACMSDQRLPDSLRHQASRTLAHQSRDASRTRVRNRCILTGRGRGVLRGFRLSRLQFRQMAANGFLPGVRRAQW